MITFQLQGPLASEKQYLDQQYPISLVVVSSAYLVRVRKEGVGECIE